MRYFMRRFSRILMLGLVVLVGSGLLVLANQIGAAQQGRDLRAAAEPWPPFIMEYTVTVHGASPDGSAAGDQVTQLDYTDRRHSTLTILAHPGGADFVGRRWTFDGDDVVIFRPPNSTTTGKSPGPEGGAVPDDWLVPGATPSLAARPGVRLTDNRDGTTTAIHEVTSNGHTETKEIRFRQVDGIPMGMIELDNQQVVRRAEVMKLEFKKG